MKYTFVISASVPMFTTVDAPTLEDGVRLAQLQPVQELCRGCGCGDGSNEASEGEWRFSGNLGELDPAGQELDDLVVPGKLDEGEFDKAVELWEYERDTNEARRG